MDLSIVIPCLNEEETIEICIRKSLRSISDLKIDGEVIVADNGSLDNSVQIAKKAGAKVVHVKKKGYGNAIINGVFEAQGKYVIMADADNSYDFNKIEDFYKKLIQGYDLVQGCRFPSGGGKIEKNAMPITHQYFGNPFFSLLSKLFFSLPFNDVYCGFRGFDRLKFIKLKHFSNGMVFAIENLIKFKVAGANCGEIPVTLHKDGRKKNKSHLNTISDGWNTLRFLMIICPKWLFFFPSATFFMIALFYLYKITQISISSNSLDLIESSLLLTFYLLISFQIFMFGLFSSLMAVKLKMLKSNLIRVFFKIFKLRYAFYVSFCLILMLFFMHSTKNDIPNLKIFYEIFIYSGSMFLVLLIINSLYVSLITLEDNF